MPASREEGSVQSSDRATEDTVELDAMCPERLDETRLNSPSAATAAEHQVTHRPLRGAARELRHVLVEGLGRELDPF